MFGFFKKLKYRPAATGAAQAIVAPIIAEFGAASINRLVDSNFFIGYICTAVDTSVWIDSRKTLGGGERVGIIIDALNSVLRINGANFVRKVNYLINIKDVEYNQGADFGFDMAALVYGLTPKDSTKFDKAIATGESLLKGHGGRPPFSSKTSGPLGYYVEFVQPLIRTILKGGAISQPQNMHAGDGSSSDAPIVIEAANSVLCISEEYRILDKKFGKKDVEWKLLDRLGMNQNGRRLDKFIISHRDKRIEVYFDVTACLAGNDAVKQFDAIDQVLGKNDVDIRISVPKEGFSFLLVAMPQIPNGLLTQVGISDEDRWKVVSNLADSAGKIDTKVPYESWPATIDITMNLLLWIRLDAVIITMKPGNIMQEEIIADLKAIIGGALEDNKKNRH